MEEKNLHNLIRTYVQEHPLSKFRLREVAEIIIGLNPDLATERINRVNKNGEKINKNLNDEKDLINQLCAEYNQDRKDSLAKKGFVFFKDENNKTSIVYDPENTLGLASDTFNIFDSINASNINNTKGLVASCSRNNSNDADDEAEEDKTQEKDLYPILWKCLKAGDINSSPIYSMRIDEKKSSKKPLGANKWLFPDMVAVSWIAEGWQSQVRELTGEMDKISQVRLYSFEVKRTLSFANLRKSFFQAVSNSSWANYSYLVSTKIQNSATLDELSMLCSSFDIGFIELDTTSQREKANIVIPAKFKQLDWTIINRISNESEDFKKYIEYIAEIFQTGKLKPYNWLCPQN